MSGEAVLGDGRAPEPARVHAIGDKLPHESAGTLRRIWHNHGLSIVLTVLFVLTLVGQTWAGWADHNQDQQEHGLAPIGLAQYLTSAHFGEATFENWESEFLQMGFYVVLTVFLYQRGSSESKRPGVIEPVDLDPRDSPNKAEAPWPVRRGGFVLTLYENSLSIAFALLFVVSFALHAYSGAHEYNSAQREHGQPPISAMAYLGTARFWFESFQNWQSEFLSLAAMVTFTIFLRQRGSPESKPVDAPCWDTGN